MAARRVLSLFRSLPRDTLKIRSTVLQNVRSLTASSYALLSQPKPSQSAEFEKILIHKQYRPQSRKRRSLTSHLKQIPKGKSVVAIALAESFNLEDISVDLFFNSMYNVNFIDEEFEDALYLAKRKEYSVNNEISEMYLFEDGVVVFWNVDADQRAGILRDLEKFAKLPYDSKIALDEQDRIMFMTGDGETCIQSDKFFLDSSKHNIDQKSTSSSILQRFAFSQGLAASVKIGVWESSLNQMSEPLLDTINALKRGKIPWNREEAMRKSGEFFGLRYSINMDSSLLNSDFYWNREDVEKYYNMSARHFTLSRRLRALNNRLDYCEELVNSIDNAHASRHSTRLEYAIIILILIEVIFDIYHFADHGPKRVVIVSPEDAIDNLSV